MRVLAIFFLALGLLGCSKQPASLNAEQAWIPLAPPTARVMGGFVQLNNPEDRDWTLVDVVAEDFGSAEIHSMEMQDGMMRMRRLDALTVPAGGQIQLRRGGHHLMLFDPAKTWTADANTLITLRFSNSTGETRELALRFTILEDAPDHAQ